MRKTLYVKDDDYRLSFLTGNFITLTNLSKKDWDKIISMRLSPLYVSVHCLQPELRAKMLGHKSGANIRHDLARLREAGIELHTQIVLCPGVNDGEVLEETIGGLSAFYPSVQSIGIVPVGLTRHRQKLPDLNTFDADKARALIDKIEQKQDDYRGQYGLGIVYLADEFYILAGREFPSAEYYDDYPQIENGIGLARILFDEFADLQNELPKRINQREVYMITGISAVPILKPILQRLNKINGLKAELIPVKNDYFGGNVSVTGLLTGRDIINTLGKDCGGKNVILSNVLLKENSHSLLDDISVEEIEKQTGARITLVDGSAGSLIEAVLGTGSEGREV